MSEINIPLTPKKKWDKNKYIAKYFSHYRWQLTLEKWSITVYRANLNRESKTWQIDGPYYGIWWNWERWISVKKLIHYDNVWYDGNHYAFGIGPICFSWGD